MNLMSPKYYFYQSLQVHCQGETAARLTESIHIHSYLSLPLGQIWLCNLFHIHATNLAKVLGISGDNLPHEELASFI